MHWSLNQIPIAKSMHRFWKLRGQKITSLYKKIWVKKKTRLQHQISVYWKYRRCNKYGNIQWPILEIKLFHELSGCILWIYSYWAIPKENWQNILSIVSKNWKKCKKHEHFCHLAYYEKYVNNFSFFDL